MVPEKRDNLIQVCVDWESGPLSALHQLQCCLSPNSGIHLPLWKRSKLYSDALKELRNLNPTYQDREINLAINTLKTELRFLNPSICDRVWESMK